eukprot:5342278-Prymnesium_polylepis.1
MACGTIRVASAWRRPKASEQHHRGIHSAGAHAHSQDWPMHVCVQRGARTRAHANAHAYAHEHEHEHAHAHAHAHAH